ncbi:cytochrome P450 [Exidia glandulosa HHB12029]|uniref:Cytochrome P450 n=1 Tax=Exidia glandulosa HHB12029 TaxID=1314781 RepID=A0A166BPB2_EXIGL|nr:cytochrome P450 [Exidia glandulosa HHB12029]
MVSCSRLSSLGRAVSGIIGRNSPHMQKQRALSSHPCRARMGTIALVSADRLNYIKDVVSYDVINLSEKNVVSSEGDRWKRHRSVVRNAFTEANNALVWDKTLRVLSEMFADFDSRSGDGTVVDATETMASLTFLIICSAGFGQSLAWSDMSEDLLPPPPGFALSFKRSLLGAVHGIFIRAACPNWLHNLPSWAVPTVAKKTRLAFDELQKHLHAMISDARAASLQDSSSSADLFRRMLDANSGIDESLSDGEVLSNIFAFLLAGHETSAHTLAFALALLALHPEAQATLREEVLGVWPTGKPSGMSDASYKDDFPRFTYTLAVLRETLRLFPPVPRLWKIVQRDAILPFRRISPDGTLAQREEFFAPKDSLVVIDFAGLYMSPTHWGDDVEAFRPARFVDTPTYQWPREAFFPFAAGPRACLGKNFAIAESVCILARIVACYDILPPPHLKGRTFEEQMEEMLKYRVVATLTPTGARVLLRKRQ